MSRAYDMGQLDYPEPLPTCTMRVPPVNTNEWSAFGWRRWFTGCCHCGMHSAFRKRHGITEPREGVY